MNNLPLLNDLRVFMLVARRAGFAAAAEELGVSPAFVSKRVSLLEQTLNVQLLHRTTRQVSATQDGLLLCGQMNARVPGSCADIAGTPYAVDVALLQYVLMEASR